MVAARALLAWVPAVLYMAGVWTLSTLGPMGVAPVFAYQDKVIHAVEYGGLAIALGYATRRTWPNLSAAREWILLVFYASVWGLLDELHQAFVPGRTADFLDLAADISGAVVACTLRLPFLRRGAAKRE